MKDIREAIGIRDLSFDLVTVKDLVDRQVLDRPIDGNHGEIHPKSEDFVPEGVPFVMASDLRNGRVDYANCAKITERQAEGLRKGFARNGDVLLTHKATIVATAIVDYDKHPYIMLTPQVTYYRVRDPKALSNRFLKHYFDSSLFQQTLHMLASSGSTRAYLGITEQQRLPVVLPPIEKQQKIAGILSAYDDLIANNQRRIALLEGMAEEIYREWFVRMRFPGWQSTARLGRLPVGWDLLPLSRAAHVNPIERIGGDEERPFVSMDRLSTTSMHFDYDELRQGAAGSKFRNGDSLLPRITPCLENGKRGLVSCLKPDEVGVGSTEFVVLRPSLIRSEHLYFLSIDESLRKHAEISMTGASGRQRVQEECLDYFLVAVPSHEVAERFSDVVGAMCKEIGLLAAQSRALIRTRDALLPRLISGKLKVDHLDIRLPPSMRAEAETVA